MNRSLSLSQTVAFSLWLVAFIANSVQMHPMVEQARAFIYYSFYIYSQDPLPSVIMYRGGGIHLEMWAWVYGCMRAWVYEGLGV